MPKSPVFIVGSPRSGTSILVDAMISVGYQGFREGNFLTLMTTIDRVVERHFSVFAKDNAQILVSQVDPILLKRRIEDIFREFTDNLNTAPLWFDKTGNPEMIQAVPTLRRFWPSSVFIFAKRRAIENITSRQKKFPGLTFEYHCADWARNMASWRKVREQIPPEVYIEVDQQDLIRKPNASSAQIAGLLELEEVHIEELVRIFRSNRPQETIAGSAEKILSLGALPWSEAQLAIFRRHCANEMEAYGYSADETYYRKAQDD
jgi:hypothetical protein